MCQSCLMKWNNLFIRLLRFPVRHLQRNHGDVIMPAPITGQQDHLVNRIIQLARLFVDEMHDLVRFEVVG